MNFSFSEVTLGEISVGNKGSYGIAASAVDFSNDLYTYLRITDINDDGTLNKDGLKSVDDENAKKYLLKPNDIVFARTGASTGRSYFYDGKDGKFVYAGFLIKFSLDPNKVNPKFMKYYTMSDEYKGWVNSFNTGSTRGNINAQTYANMKILLPDRKQQDLIVDTFSYLDDRIELNNRINKTLEETAQAIFKSWFVDFEPFHEEEFEDSELGRIPKGWRAGTLSELIIVRYGKDHKKLGEGDIPVYGSGGVMRFVNTSLYSSESVLIPRKGTLNNVIYVNEPFWSVDTMFFTEMKYPNLAKFIYFFVSAKDLLSMNAGSAVPSMTTDILNKMQVVIPPEAVLRQFDEVVSPLFLRIKTSLNENKVLSSVRETLLPKLMSGEIQVPIEEVQ